MFPLLKPIFCCCTSDSEISPESNPQAQKTKTTKMGEKKKICPTDTATSDLSLSIINGNQSSYSENRTACLDVSYIEYNLAPKYNGTMASVKYIFKDGVQSMAIYQEGTVHEEIHEGTFLNGLLHGKGKIYWPKYTDNKCRRVECQIYEGIFKNGKITSGIISAIDGTTCRGTYNSEGALCGEGALEYPNGGGEYGFFEEGVLRTGERVQGNGLKSEKGKFDEMGFLTNGIRVVKGFPPEVIGEKPISENS